MSYSLIANSWGAFPMMGLGIGAFALGSILMLALILCIIALKGYALWHAAKRDEKPWFIALLLINTMGILELFYLYVIVGKWKTPKVKVEDKKDEVNTGNTTTSK